MRIHLYISLFVHVAISHMLLIYMWTNLKNLYCLCNKYLELLINRAFCKIGLLLFQMLITWNTLSCSIVIGWLLKLSSQPDLYR